jgi:uncharacterized protein (UPF0276 family)
LHIVGYAVEGERLMDSHGAAIQPELLDLAREIVIRSAVQSVILERDANFGDVPSLEKELAKLTALILASDGVANG